MKRNIFIILLFSLFTHSLIQAQTNQEPILIKLNRAVVYGEIVEGNFEGSLEDYTNSDMFTREHSNGELSFTIIDNLNYFKNIKNVARYFWKYLGENANVTPPYPCGPYLLGVIRENQTKNSEGVIIHYEITGEGDGSFDSCKGIGGPGWWSYRIVLEFDPKKLTGIVNYSFEEE